MADTQTTRFQFLKQDYDSHPEDWGTQVNAIFDALDQIVAGAGSLAAASTTAALSVSQLSYAVIRVTGVLTANQIYTVPVAMTARWIIVNDTTGAFTLTFMVSGQTGVVIPQGAAKIVRNNGTDVVEVPVATDAASGKGRWVGALTFAADAYVAAANNYIPATLFEGLTITGRIANANATTTPTLAYAGGAAKTIVHGDGTALAVGELSVPLIATFTYLASDDKWHLSYQKASSTPGQVSGSFALAGELTASTITNDKNNYGPGGIADATTLFLSADADGHKITGIIGGRAGRILILENVGTKYLVLRDQIDTSSNAENRLDLGGVHRFLWPGSIVILKYNGSTSMWTILTTKHTWREVDLGAVTVSSNMGTPVSHGLSNYPTNWDAFIECTTGNLGYAVGYRVKPSTDYVTLAVSASLIRVTVSTEIKILNTGTTNFVPITPSSWKIIVRLYE